MASIGSVSGSAAYNNVNALAAQKASSAAAGGVKKDSDGDFDGTKPGQVDLKDLGKGVSIDRLA